MSPTVADEADLLWRWTETVTRAADGPAATEAVTAVGRDLLTRYSEPTRRYHDVRHLTDVLDRIDHLAEFTREIDTVRLAAWFHDAIYDPHRGDNEEASAQLAAGALARCGVDDPTAAEVSRLVLLTAGHAPDAGDPDGAVLCDADLAVLSTAPERYAVYVADVRAEYAHVPDEAFREGRTAILSDLAARDRLFGTDYGRAHWEKRARHNLAAELILLTRPEDLVREPEENRPED
ncbi:Predicted metal-dependent phosphohydrolase, HD superfamily [Actinopolymorpha cephalotaxi]|uniref:Metal-dependent HD superfamily phosphohydrolase n=1 Tax=Actinopolymorpha cephalotaxi TaxID=504797 RepID=A0A1I3B4T8_9ACTN|nr:metal-dependent phosphohydrolase [Actinopolymorpha cephalotaxi]NYH81245.1 putative metal-dependent HD superfamily phosphohydrolase [Actinopolymorpha cephalotaxi]SFH57242.1 Predicted metal-dependent phosphohydrolase, HD superfamily [Actinopolymorpha cephalotaxi]